MLDMGFIPDIENICTKLPANRQTLLFSATMPPPIKKLADKFLSNPKTIEVARPATANINITQYVVPVSSTSHAKRAALRQLLGQEEVKNAIIFCNRKTTVRELNKSLRGYGFSSGEIHGDMEQPQRIAELERFKKGEINILVASDVAARGLDIKGVSHVFNFDAPWHPDDYIHRIGRTGRAGATGIAYTLASSADAENIENIEKLTGMKIPRLEGGPPPEAEEKPRARAARDEKPKRARAAPREKAAAAETPEAPAPRAEKPVRREEPRAPREEARPRREDPRPPRDEPRARNDDRRPRRGREQDDGPDEGWNGPIPDFLNAVLTHD
jgi:superfamily II DNA/RNA helicase